MGIGLVLLDVHVILDEVNQGHLLCDHVGFRDCRILGG